MSNEFQTLPLSALHESPHNPRKHFDAASLNDLADSIREVGIITPLLVRPNANGYEIAAGHRRFRAAKLAELEQVPCLVRPLTDQQFMECLTIENLQREDVHALDEAKGYEALMAAPYKMPVEKIAERVGRSVKYIYDRVKLLALTKDAQQLFWDGKIEAGHAILLARLTPAEQAKVIGDPEAGYANGGLFQAEHDLYDEENPGDDDPVKCRSVRELEAYIKRHIRFNAKAADTFLFPETVASVTSARQAKRKIIEITHEYLAHDDVRHAGESRVYGERAWKRADGHEGSKPCERSVLGVIASGPGQGQAFDVCVNKDKCTVHWGAKIKARKKRQKQQEKGSTNFSIADRDRQAREQEAKERAREEARRARWEKARPGMKQKIAQLIRSKPIGALMNGGIGQALYQRCKSWNMKKAEAELVPNGKSAEAFVRHLGWLLALDDLSYELRAAHVLKGLGLKADALLNEFAPEKPAAQVSAQAKKKPNTRRVA